MSGRFPVLLDRAEREWLVVNYVDVGVALRGLLLGIYLALRENDITLTVYFAEEELVDMDRLISKSNPFHTKMASGHLLSELGEKVWLHLAREYAPAQFKPAPDIEEVLVVNVSSSNDPYDDTDQNAAQHATVRGPRYY